MAGSGNRAAGVQLSASDIAQMHNGQALPAGARQGAGSVRGTVTLDRVTMRMRADARATRVRVACSAAVLAVLAFLSFGVMGAMGQNYAYSSAYAFYAPDEVARILCEHAYNALGDVTHRWPSHSNEWIRDNMPGYWAVWHRVGVVGITVTCGVLLSVAGMLYQNVFRNPLAGPGILGVSSGVSLGILLLVVLYGTASVDMLKERYLFCYGFGAAILLFVVAAGRRLSGKGRPFDIVTMLLIGGIFGQLAGFVQQYVMLFLFADDADIQNVFIELQQMLVVDTSALSWSCLAIAFAVAFVPVYAMRFRMNALAFSEEEVRLFGINFTRLRAVALLSGAVMVLAAQIHTGMVGMVSMIVPFMSRSWFGAEFSKQLVGNVCIGSVLLLICRDIADCIPFVGDGLGLGVIVSVVVMPLFVAIMAKHLNSWE